MEENIQNIAKKIVEDGKGILAADESTNTIKKRFDSIKVESNEKTRCNYRDTLFSTPNISKYIGGIYHSRHHIGDPGAVNNPFVIVPAEKQRESLNFILTHICFVDLILLFNLVTNRRSDALDPSFLIINYV